MNFEESGVEVREDDNLFGRSGIIDDLNGFE